MKSMIKQQRGVTFLGWCIVLAIIAFFVLITLRLFPLYNEKFNVMTAMKSVAARPNVEKMSDPEVVRTFLKTIQVSGTQRFDDETVKKLVKIDKPKKGGEKRALHITFIATSKFFDDIEFMLNFDKSLELGGVAKE